MWPTGLQCCISFDSYIKPQLGTCQKGWPRSCISFDSYIKPQLKSFLKSARESCISFDSYIKPQPTAVQSRSSAVVYLLIPTSNHNVWKLLDLTLIVVYLLIPTSNHNFFSSRAVPWSLYIF